MALLNLFNTPYSAEPVDLQKVTWDFKSSRSTDGVVPKAYYQGAYYKLSSFNSYDGFYGNEAVTECVVSDILDTMGVPHVKYRLVMGDILYEDKHYQAPVCTSQDFNPKKRPVVSLERYLRSHVSGKSPLEACIELGFEDYVYTMFLVDFLILNRDRHGSNIELVDGKLVPLFDHGLALMALQNIHKWNHWSGDIVNNFVGSTSLRKNLFMIPADAWPSVREPDVSVISRFSNFWERDRIALAQKMLRERWAVIAARREELQ